MLFVSQLTWQLKQRLHTPICVTMVIVNKSAFVTYHATPISFVHAQPMLLTMPLRHKSVTQIGVCKSGLTANIFGNGDCHRLVRSLNKHFFITHMNLTQRY